MTQITTLEQAEIALYRANAVQQYNNQPMVEGKQLLDICGFSYHGTEGRDNSKLILDRQIARHSLTEDQDFTVNIRVDGRVRRSVYHFTVNAANHILLAAMTPQGYEARQEAIDNQQQQQAVSSSQPRTQIQVLAQIANEMAAMEERQIRQQEELQNQNTRLETVEHRLETRSVRLGYIFRTDARRKYCPNLSENIVKDIITTYEIPSEYQMTVANGFAVQSMIVHEEIFRDTVQTFLEEITPIFEGSCYYKHPNLRNKRFKA